MNSRSIGLIAGTAFGLTTSVAAQPVSISPSTMPSIGTVDARYQSYNVEALEVTGGKFWKPYGPEFDAILKSPAPASDASSGDTPPEWIRACMNTGSRSIWATPGCASSPPHSGRPTCGSAAPGAIPVIFRRRNGRQPNRPQASATCWRSSGGRTSSISPGGERADRDIVRDRRWRA